MGRLYTIGHSTVSADFFFGLLQLYRVDCLFDVRSVPYSKHAAQFDRESLAAALKKIGIRYVYMGTYFGARQGNRNLYDSEGILDFEKVRAEKSFKIRMESVEKGLSQGHNIALMCTEKDPFDCHRAIMVARGFELDKVEVNHILHDEKLLSQSQLDARLLDSFFPHRDQGALNFDDTPEKTEQEYLAEAYRRRNKQIGYHFASNREEIL